MSFPCPTSLGSLPVPGCRRPFRWAFPCLRKKTVHRLPAACRRGMSHRGCFINATYTDACFLSVSSVFPIALQSASNVLALRPKGMPFAWPSRTEISPQGTFYSSHGLGPESEVAPVVAGYGMPGGGILYGRRNPYDWQGLHPQRRGVQSAPSAMRAGAVEPRVLHQRAAYVEREDVGQKQTGVPADGPGVVLPSTCRRSMRV